MDKYTTYVGLDVHARSIEASAVDVETGEEFRRSFRGCPGAAEVAGWLATLPQPVYCAYESGGCGFTLARGLRAQGFDCDVIAVSTLPRSGRDRRQKCDRLDARAIRREAANPDRGYHAVWVPDEATEGLRDLVRCYAVAADGAKRAKQRLLMFLQRHGHVWDERTKTGRRKKAWTRDFERWLDSISLGEEAAERAFAAYRRQVREARREVAELRAEVLELAGRPESKPIVDAMCLFKGVDTVTAMIVRAEIGDFERFGSAASVSSWAGTTPSDRSSGESERHGGITKAGDRYVRRALVEGCAGIAMWGAGPKAVPRGAEPSAAALEIAARGNRRLRERYDHLAREARKAPNKARVAVVNELIRWLWVAGLQAQREMREGAAA